MLGNLAKIAWTYGGLFFTSGIYKKVGRSAIVRKSNIVVGKLKVLRAGRALPSFARVAKPVGIIGVASWVYNKLDNFGISDVDKSAGFFGLMSGVLVAVAGIGIGVVKKLGTFVMIVVFGSLVGFLGYRIMNREFALEDVLMSQGEEPEALR